jgi:8-oxo-dGTP pyrophosphatase MutT (NUDIX family)
MTEKGSLPWQIKKMLDNKEPRELKDSETNYIHAAVLVPLFKNDHGYQILFTERTHKVEHHKGQISFPGGAVESQDKSYEETALREACEEIGLLPKHVEVLGRLDDETTVASQFIVHPFVGLIPHPYEFKTNQAEVEKLINVPFKYFLSDDPAHKCSSIDFDDFTYHGTVYLHQGDVIWGATARIMDHFICEIQDNIPIKSYDV